ncbi:MAG: hypothetical protein Q8P35_00185 [Candidatus Yanofskybacteria bacterium]|nr:hypothetical protein [Candidatus Yanofskybacteria bacterium]
MIRLSRIIVGLAILGSFFILPASRADTEGQREFFKVNSEYDISGRSTIAATLRFVGEKAYFYIEDTYWDNLTQSQRANTLQEMTSLSVEFDTKIYPTETAFWGNEARPGVDNDPKVTILFQDLKSGFGGYFDSIHGYSKALAGDSNQREMIFLNAKSLGSNLGKVFLAHEFHHLISHNQKELIRNVSETIWLNEARAEYTSSLLGYNNPFPGSNLDRRARLFTQNPSNSLTQWPNETADYAIAAVFAEYLVGRYGPGILSETLDYSSAGIISINEYFSNKRFTERFADVFSDWMIASYLNVPGDSRFGYSQTNLRELQVSTQYKQSISNSLTGLISAVIRQWQPTWFEFQLLSPSQAVKLEFQGTLETSFRIPYVAFYTDGSYEISSSLAVRGLKTLYVQGSKTSDGSRRFIQRIVLAAAAEGRIPEVSQEEPGFALAIRTLLVSDAEAEAAIAEISAAQESDLKNGILIKRIGREPEIYVIEGGYKRYLRPEVIASYGHLKDVQPIEVNDAVFNSFITANYIRHVNQLRVYAVWPDGTKHWLNMTGDYFSQSGRDWNSIFIVNDGEFNLYQPGIDITR